MGVFFQLLHISYDPVMPNPRLIIFSRLQNRTSAVVFFFILVQLVSVIVFLNMNDFIFPVASLS